MHVVCSIQPIPCLLMLWRLYEPRKSTGMILTHHSRNISSPALEEFKLTTSKPETYRECHAYCFWSSLVCLVALINSRSVHSNPFISLKVLNTNALWFQMIESEFIVCLYYLMIHLSTFPSVVALRQSSDYPSTREVTIDWNFNSAKLKNEKNLRRTEVCIIRGTYCMAVICEFPIRPLCYLSYRWFSTWLQYLQCVRNGDTAVLW